MRWILEQWIKENSRADSGTGRGKQIRQETRQMEQKDPDKQVGNGQEKETSTRWETKEKEKGKEKGSTRRLSLEAAGNAMPQDIQPGIALRMGKDTGDIARYAGNRAIVQACVPKEKEKGKEI